MTPRLHVRRLGALTRQYEGGGINAASFSCRKERQGCPVRVNAYAGAVESSDLIYADIAPHTIGTARFIATLVAPMSPPCVWSNGLWSD